MGVKKEEVRGGLMDVAFGRATLAEEPGRLHVGMV